MQLVCYCYYVHGEMHSVAVFYPEPVQPTPPNPPGEVAQGGKRVPARE